MRRWVEEGCEHVAVPCDLQRPPSDLGRIVDELLFGPSLQIERRRLGRERLGGRQLLARHQGLRHRPLLDGPDRLARLAVQRIEEGLLGGLEQSLDLFAIDCDVHQDRGGGCVVVPDVVMDQLVVPSPFAGLDVQRDDARAEEVVTRTKTAVKVHGGAVRRDIDEAQLRVSRHRRPRRHVAGPFPRVVLPRVMPELARTRDDVELPLQVSRASVVRHDVARDHLDPRLVVPLLGRVPDDHHIIDHDGRRRSRDIADLQRNALVGIVLLIQALPRFPALDQIREQVHAAGGREAINRHAFPPTFERLTGLGVQRVKEEARRRDVHDAPAIDLTVRDSLSVTGPHGVLPASRVRLGEAPQQLSSRWIEGNHMSTVSGDRDQLAIDISRRRAGRARTEALRLPLPQHFEILEVGRVDFGRRRVARVPRVPAEERPLSVFRPRSLSRYRHRRRDQYAEPECKRDERGQTPKPPAIVVRHDRLRSRVRPASVRVTAAILTVRAAARKLLDGARVRGPAIE